MKKAYSNTRLQPLFIVLTFSYMGLIFYMSHQQNIQTPFPAYRTDLLLHLIEYLILGILLTYSINNLRKKGLHLVLLIGILFGLSDEIHQYFIPGRFFSCLDVLSDSLGIYLGFMLSRKFIHQTLKI